VRFVSAIVLGVMESAVVASVHVAPTLVLAVAVQGTVNEYGTSDMVAVSVPVAPLRLSVMRRAILPWTSPV
jgi:hypothetical protein